MYNQIFLSFLIPLFIIFFGKKNLKSINKINLFPFFLIIYLLATKIIFKSSILQLFKNLNIGYSFDVFLIFTIISIFYIVIFFEFKFIFNVSEKTTMFYYFIIFFSIFYFYLEKFYDHNYSTNKTSFLDLNLFFLGFLFLKILISENNLVSKYVNKISKIIIFIIFLNLITQSSFINDLGDFDNGRYINEVSAIFSNRKLHVDFFNFSGVFPSMLYKNFATKSLDSLIDFRIFLRLSLILFSLIIGVLIYKTNNLKNINKSFILLISINFLNPYLTLRAYSKIFTFLIIMIFYFLICNKFSYLKLYFLSFFSTVYFIELPTLSIFIIISILLILIKDFSLKKSLTFFIFLVFNLSIYTLIMKVTLSNILLIPLSLGSNSIPFTFRDMPVIGPLDAHVILLGLLTPKIIDSKDLKLKFLLMSSISFTVYYSHNSDFNHLLFTTILVMTILIIVFSTSRVISEHNNFFIPLIVLLILNPTFQFVQNPNLNLFKISEYSSNSDYDQGNIQISEFIKINTIINSLKVENNSVGVLSPNANISEFLYDLNTPNIISWPEELLFDEKIYILFCDYFNNSNYKIIAAKENHFDYYVTGFENKNVIDSGYSNFKICDFNYDLINFYVFNNNTWLIFQKTIKN